MTDAQGRSAARKLAISPGSCLHSTGLSRKLLMPTVWIIWFLCLQQKAVAGPGPGDKKYPALLWEITGNGLSKPSYLFGTMHVSSKMVFHLSDSFYFGIRNADVVALELDPQLWQDQLFRYQNMQSNLRFYTGGSPNDYLNEKSFQLEKYEDRLRYALSEEPTLINGLLYRTVQPKADFEEDTYLDLYIYQTGKKLGKQATGVENYFETERLILEASQDMMKDKKKRNPDMDGESLYDIERKSQEAYRKGDLDMLDSLEKLLQPSAAYMEKFLYRRNEIQANSVDSIIRKHSLFVGVGAAHLPGRRGVIELLRRKGYTLRPISMRDQDALQRDDIDKVKVPVVFSTYTSEDKSFSVKLPGKLYKRSDSRTGDSWQYADMSNGAYYMITRVKTHGYMSGQGEAAVFKKIDSLLYENVPGKILSRKIIHRDGSIGLNVVNKTRRGDIQRYNIIETPFEIFIFKMSGNGNYVEGKEAEQFFNSITVNANRGRGWTEFEPIRGGFSVKLPATPSEYMDNSGFESSPRWEFEANDSTNGDAYLIWKRTIQNFRFLEEDSFDLSLMEESFRLSDAIDKRLNRQFTTTAEYRGLDANYSMKDGSFISARFIVKGPHYYMLAVRTRDRNKHFPVFFDSFRFRPYRYHPGKAYIDSFVNISVRTPIIPDIDAAVRGIMENATSEEFLDAVSESSRYWPKNKTALFEDDSTGEAVYVSVQTYPRYYYPKDSAGFWKEESNEARIKEDFIIKSKTPFRFSDSVGGWKYVFSDTNSSRVIHNWLFVKDNRLYRVINLADSSDDGGQFVKQFYASLYPLGKTPPISVFTDKLNLFFSDFYSADSSLNKKARDAIQNVYFGPAGLPLLLKAISTLPYNNRDYFQVKSKLINELGYITDSSCRDEVVAGLKRIYESVRDTGTFQNAVFKSLARNKSKQSYALLKTLLIQDPPVFDDADDYNALFSQVSDSLALAASLFPEILQLSTVDDYKDNIRSLLAWLVDSSYLKANDYASYFDKLFFDAKIELKKQRARDERKSQKKPDDNALSDYGNGDHDNDDDGNVLNDYAILLAPFYERDKAVPEFFDRLLRSTDMDLRMNTLVLLLRANKKVPDSTILSLAVSDRYRSRLWKELESINREDKFPEKYKIQEQIARSQLVRSHTAEDFYAIEQVAKELVHLKQDSGFVYFFRYKISRDDDWQMGISGLQPFDEKKISSNDALVKLTNRKIKTDEPALDQFREQLKKLIYSKHKSAASFYLDNDYYLPRGDDDD